MAKPSANNEVDSEEDSDIDLGTNEDRRCLHCGQINTRKPDIQCNLCMGNYHITCVKVKRAVARVLPNYSCATCRNATAPTVSQGMMAIRHRRSLIYPNI